MRIRCEIKVTYECIRSKIEATSKFLRIETEMRLARRRPEIELFLDFEAISKWNCIELEVSSKRVCRKRDV